MNLAPPSLGAFRAMPFFLSLAVVLLTACGDSSEFKTTKEKALTGDPQSQLDLGMMFFLGKGTKVNNDEGVKWCRQAADKGLPAAQRTYGLMLCNGGGVPRNQAQGRIWLERAANKGDVMAQVELASMLGVFSPPFDHVEAMKWLILAEKAGSTNAPAIIKLVAPEMSPAQMSEARAKAEAFEKEK